MWGFMNNYSNMYVLMVLLCFSLEAHSAKILFVGCLDAEAELDFKKNILHLDSDNDEVIFTSYSGPETKLTILLKAKNNPKHSYLSKVDATTLNKDKRFKKDFYDYIVWVGPRADPGDEKNTGILVKEFFKAATEVVKRDTGVICIAQKLDSPHFSDIKKELKSVNKKMMNERVIYIKNRKKSDGTPLYGNRGDHLHCINKKSEDVTSTIMKLNQ